MLKQSRQDDLFPTLETFIKAAYYKLTAAVNERELTDAECWMLQESARMYECITHG